MGIRLTAIKSLELRTNGEKEVDEARKTRSFLKPHEVTDFPFAKMPASEAGYVLPYADRISDVSLKS